MGYSDQFPKRARRLHRKPAETQNTPEPTPSTSVSPEPAGEVKASVDLIDQLLDRLEARLATKDERSAPVIHSKQLDSERVQARQQILAESEQEYWAARTRVRDRMVQIGEEIEREPWEWVDNTTGQEFRGDYRGYEYIVRPGGAKLPEGAALDYRMRYAEFERSCRLDALGQINDANEHLITPRGNDTFKQWRRDVEYVGNIDIHPRDFRRTRQFKGLH
jgi:hypothetical protein